MDELEAGKAVGDAIILERAVQVFERRGWIDVPGYPAIVRSTTAHLAYRAKALRLEAESGGSGD